MSLSTVRLLTIAPPACPRSPLATGRLGALLLLALAALLPSSPGAAEPAPGPTPRWTGDLDAMLERRFVRVATTFSRTNFFLDDGVPRGVTWEFLTEFEKALNVGRGPGETVRMVFLPMDRDELLDAVVEGRADIAAANLTVTAERAEQVAFSTPVARDVSELLVTHGDAVPALERLEDLAGRRIHVRPSSSYRQTLERIGRALSERGLAPPVVVPVDEHVETEDILELVSAGVFEATVADSGLAKLWADVLPDLTVHDAVPLAEGRTIAWAFRPGSAKLAAAIDAFLADHRQGTLFGNVVIKRYFADNRWVRNPLEDEDRGRFETYADFFRRYAERYGVDWLLAAAQGYQESGFDQSRVSHAGAIGIMQVKPETAADPNVGIPEIRVAENNIHAGIKYKAFIRERYFADEAMDEFNRLLFSLASYNAGPARVRRYRERAAERGLDPNRWFRNVEQVANRETVRYVANILKYYVAYREFLARQDAEGAAAADS